MIRRSIKNKQNVADGLRHGANKSPRVKSVTVIACAVLLLLAVAGATFAIIKKSTGTTTNKFVPADIKGEVQENFEDGGEEKKDVKFKNTGDANAYCRVALVMTWQNDANEVFAVPVTSDDYTLTLNSSTNWKKGSDGYYYYISPVAPQGTTDKLINSFKPKNDNAPDRCHFVLDVLADWVQSEPDDAVESAWGKTVSGGKLVIS